MTKLIFEDTVKNIQAKHKVEIAKMHEELDKKQQEIDKLKENFKKFGDESIKVFEEDRVEMAEKYVKEVLKVKDECNRILNAEYDKMDKEIEKIKEDCNRQLEIERAKQIPVLSEIFWRFRQFFANQDADESKKLSTIRQNRRRV
jgi:molecular chaperone GrpE (heat shock protein)